MSSRPVRLAVVGLGRAGQARVRAIEARPGCALAATVGRRPGHGTASFEAVCADPAIDGLIICSENAHHFAAAETGLRAGKHVIVEFPLAATAHEARHLFALAKAAGRVLHTEFIGLLTARHTAIRALCRRGEVADLTITFTGGQYRWVGEEVRAGRLGQLAMGRLQALLDWFGPLTVRHAEAESDAEGYRLTVDLLAADGRKARLIEARRPEAGRGMTLSAFDAQGAAVELPRPAEPGDLFGRDLDLALTRIATQNATGAYVSDAAIVDALALAEHISLLVAPALYQPAPIC